MPVSKRSRPFRFGDAVTVKVGTDKGCKGIVHTVSLDARGLRIAHVAIDTEFGICVRWVPNTWLRRAR